MANVYRVIYTGEFCDKAGDTILLEFSRPLPEGGPIPTPIELILGGESSNPFTVEYSSEGSDENYKLNPIQASSATIVLKAIGDFELSEMYTEDEREWHVKASGAENWQGWVIPDGCYEPYASKPYDVSIKCTDAIGTLKDVPFLKPDKTKYRGYEQDRNLVFDILAKTGLSLDIGHAVNTFEATMFTSLSPLAQTYPNTAVFLDDNNIPLSCYDVLKSILQRWSCVLRQVDGMWQIVNILEKSRGVVNMWVFNADNTIGTARNIGNTVTVGGLNRIFSPANANNGFAKAFAASTAYYKYGYPSNDLLNPNFDDAITPALPDHWVSQDGAVAHSEVVTDPVTSAATNNHYLVITSCPNDGSFIVNDTPVVIRSGEQVQVSFVFRCDDLPGGMSANDKLYLALQLRADDGWHFTDNKGWVSYGAAYRKMYRAKDVDATDVSIDFSIPDRGKDYALDIGLRLLTDQDSSDQYTTKFDEVKLAPQNETVLSKPPVGVYNRQTQKASLTYRPDPILLLNSDDPNLLRNSRLSIGAPSPVQTPTTWRRMGEFSENATLMHIVANSELRLHQRAYRVFEADFVKVQPFEPDRIDPNTLVTIDLLSGVYLFLSGSYNYKSGIHTLRLAEVLTAEPDYYEVLVEDYGSEKDKEGTSVGSPSGVTLPPVSGGGGSTDTQYIEPEIIPFDWSVTPVTEIDMTIGGRSIFGKYPKIEIWNTIDADNEVLYPGQYQMKRVLDAGMLEKIEFPDLDMEFAASQTGYFKLSK